MARVSRPPPTERRAPDVVDTAPASGVTAVRARPNTRVLGLAIGTGGVGVTLLGWIADHWGLYAALHLVAVLPLAGLAVALCLPEPAPEVS